MKNKILVILSIIIFSVLLSLLIKQQVLSTLLEKIIFNAVAVLVGLSIAVIGIFLSSINTMYMSIYRLTKTKDNHTFSDQDIERIKEGLSSLVDELKENALFSLYVFIAVLLLFFFKEIDLPYIKWFIEIKLLSKVFMLNTLILIGNFLIFYAIIDSIKVVFKITKAFELMKDE
ncbi:MAG: hypothetical protein GX638_07860 [Crenarchaeota archaeon]|nr:hypothetical protein [Thermoproteota archaeon]